MLILGKDTHEGPVARLRAHVRPAGRGLPRPRARAGREDRQQRRRAQPGRPRRPAARGRRRGSASTRRSRTSRATTCRAARSVRRRADRQRLPRRLRHRRRAHAPAPTSWSPAGSPTPRSWSGRRSRTSAGRRRRTTSSPAPSSPGHVIECGDPGHRRQLLRLPRAVADGMDPAAAGLPARRDRRRRLERDHQARRHRRRGHRRHGHRAAGLRDPVDPLPRPRRHHAPRHDPARRRTARTGSRITGVRGEAPPEQLKVCVNELGGFRNTVEFVLTGLDIEAKADWVREQLDRRR